MFYVVAFLLGLLQGGISVFLYLMEKHKQFRAKEKRLNAEMAGLRAATEARQQELADRSAESGAWVAAKEAEFVRKEEESTAKIQAKESAMNLHVAQMRSKFVAKEAELDQREAALQVQLNELSNRIITYMELSQENAILKRDLRNMDIHVNKLQLDGEILGTQQKLLDQRSIDLAKRYLNETAKSVVAAVGPNNFSACKERLLDVIARCRDIGFVISTDEETRLVSALRAEFERAVKAAIEREEQAKIKAQIREEERLKREVDRELKQLERERAAIQAALDQVLAEAKDKHSSEVESLRARLAEAEEKSKRAISLAQQTKAGNVYVISNVGAFGEGVYKIGMTRRLDPMDRVKELGDASVPFPFDVHMMIACTDAPALENALHRELHKRRVNRANPRKEFFKTDVDAICQIVREHHGEVQYVADPEALEYRQSLAMSDEDSDFIESVYDAADRDNKTVADE